MNYLKEYFKNGTNFSGRTNKKDFWCTILSVLIAYVILYGIIFLLTKIVPGDIAGIVGIIVVVIALIWAIVNFICILALTTRRLHDANRDSLWLILSIFIPVLWIVVLVFCLDNSVIENNKFFK